MTSVMTFFKAMAGLTFMLTSVAASAADYPAPKQGTWTARDFKFHTGEVMPEMKIVYTTIGEPPASRCWWCTVPAARPEAC